MLKIALADEPKSKGNLLAVLNKNPSSPMYKQIHYQDFGYKKHITFL